MCVNVHLLTPSCVSFVVNIRICGEALWVNFIVGLLFKECVM